jgi:hypothetical protein
MFFQEAKLEIIPIHPFQNGAHPASYPMGTRALSLGVKRPGREADHSPPSSAEVKGCVELYFHSPNMPSWSGAQLKKHRENFIFTFTPTQIRLSVKYSYIITK